MRIELAFKNNHGSAWKENACYFYHEVGGRKMISEGLNQADACVQAVFLSRLEFKIPKGKGEWI